LKGSAETIVAEPAWIIVAPPDFAPSLENVVTLYDVVYNIMAKFVDQSLAVTKDTIVSFTRDVYPILRRVSALHWVSNVAAGGHGPGHRMHFESRIPELATNTKDTADLRGFIFKKLRRPSGGGGNMPKLPATLTNENVINASVALTECQYERMRKWADGTFEADWPAGGAVPRPRRLEDLSAPDRPAALDRAALEACVGGGFFPGIEVGRIMLERSTYAEHTPFRINPNRFPGDLTARMAVPWQADFFACALQVDPDDDPDNPENGMDWWPAQRPVNVLRDEHVTDWTSEIKTVEQMVENWHELGFIVKEEGTERFVERHARKKRRT
jgi:hypothetical protein